MVVFQLDRIVRVTLENYQIKFVELCDEWYEQVFRGLSNEQVKQLSSHFQEIKKILDELEESGTY